MSKASLEEIVATMRELLPKGQRFVYVDGDRQFEYEILLDIKHEPSLAGFVPVFAWGMKIDGNDVWITGDESTFTLMVTDAVVEP